VRLGARVVPPPSCFPARRHVAGGRWRGPLGDRGHDPTLPPPAMAPGRSQWPAHPPPACGVIGKPIPTIAPRRRARAAGTNPTRILVMPVVSAYPANPAGHGGL